MKTLTKAEEQIMQKLWDLKRAHVKDIIAELPRPKPAYNTVSTIIRILEKKGFVGHRTEGKTYEYYPLITKKAYRKAFFSHFFKNYFSNSYRSFTSFFAKDQDLSLEELEEMQRIIQEEIEKKNNL
ncbi:BlaI/MecI/CopY family transcriptional regulator [Candidatus Sulfidibacterium hydrothermale]|uniref:BlaI/MecI/CopY family transcriptional regulator n=1 Tax=Candidatus Sulfidibacterium hydrothermale TaxID=2875962 RepID=UPI001F0AA9C5|nr:BlaI/MecI/CopY family transcriptional regulator [Candidatus Sulfidibacterium hydrothermale]UBM62089.1 BlaI/MecI/CopY family transcriptional regulator [Candidatus Sulfidibacterium hydrothermale]